MWSSSEAQPRAVRSTGCTLLCMVLGGCWAVRVLGRRRGRGQVQTQGLRAGGKEDLHSSSTPTTTPSCPSPTCPGDVVLSLDVEPGDESCSFAYRRRPVYLWCGWCHFPRPHWAPFTVPCLAVRSKQSLPGFSSLTSSWPSVSCEQFSHFGPSAVSLLVTGPTGQSRGAAKAASGLRPLCESWQHAFLAPRGNSRVC